MSNCDFFFKQPIPIFTNISYNMALKRFRIDVESIDMVTVCEEQASQYQINVTCIR